MEVGNPGRDYFFFFFDLGSGSLANVNGGHLPVTATTKVFLPHLHADHAGDLPTLVWSLVKAGRRHPFAWPVIGPTTITGPQMNPPSPRPAGWADPLIMD
jgi:ribonuclease Z